MTKQELQAQASELQKQLNKLTKKIANCKDEPKMFPQKGEEYWHWNQMGSIFSNKTHGSEGRLNVYKTKEEAERARDIQWAKQHVAHRIAVLNDGWTPDWSDIQTRKYFLAKDTYDLRIDHNLFHKLQPNWMYCKTAEIAQQLIEECSDDLMLIFSE
jgi:hypothetical protein